jgi:AcrR family transcriptional regulator
VVQEVGTAPIGVKERNRRRIVAAAREVVGAAGVEGLSMRSLASAAGVSVRTLYNLFGTKDAIVRALATDVLEKLDAQVVGVEGVDAIAEARAELTAFVDVVLEHSPPALVLAILADEHLVRELNAGWYSRGVLEGSIRRAIEAGLLEDELSPAALAELITDAYVRYLRMWAAGVLDAKSFRARVLYAFDACLAAVAREPVRSELLRHARRLEQERNPSAVA